MWLTLALTVLVCLFLWKLRRSSRARTPGRTIPAPTGWPLLGNALDVPINKLHLHCSSLANQFGSIMKLNIFGSSVVFLNDANLVRRAFSEEPYQKFMNDRPIHFAGTYILFQNENLAGVPYGRLYVKCRKLFKTALRIHGKGMEETFTDELQTLVDKLSVDMHKQPPLDQMLHASLTNAMTILLYGEPVIREDHLATLRDFDKYTNQLFQPDTDGVLTAFPFLRHLPGKYGNLYRAACRARNLLQQIFYYDLKKTYKRGVERGIIDVFLRIQEDSVSKGETWCTDTVLFCLVINLFVAGLLPSLSSILTFVLLMLHHYDVQRKLQIEIDYVIGPDRKPRTADRDSMPYTEATILEMWRLVSLNAFGLPHTCNADISFDGYDVRKNSFVFANLWYIHHDVKIWGDPWSFRPERFLDKDGRLLSADSALRQKLLTFGVGRRQCPGEPFAHARIFLYITTLLQNFTFLPPKQEVIPTWDPREFNSGIVLMPPKFKYFAERRIKTNV